MISVLSYYTWSHTRCVFPSLDFISPHLKMWRRMTLSHLLQVMRGDGDEWVMVWKNQWAWRMYTLASSCLSLCDAGRLPG